MFERGNCTLCTVCGRLARPVWVRKVSILASAECVSGDLAKISSIYSIYIHSMPFVKIVQSVYQSPRGSCLMKTNGAGKLVRLSF
jgi:hypothetical protein